MKAAFVIMSTAATSPANPPQRESAELYYDDPFSWSVEQSDALRRRDFAAVDWDHVIEEIKDVGERHHDSWVSQCSRAIRHLLKIEHHCEASPSNLEGWEDEVQDARDEMLTIVEKHPGLKHRLSSMFAAAWNPARRKACRELAGYDVENKIVPDKRLAAKRRDVSLPRSCPYLFNDVTGIVFTRGSKDPSVDPSALPPQVSKVLDLRRSRSPEWDR